MDRPSSDDVDAGDGGLRGLADRLRGSVEEAANRRQENAEAFADRQRSRQDVTAEADADDDPVSIDLGVDDSGTPVIDVAIEIPELAQRAGVALDLPGLSGPLPLEGDDADGGEPDFGYAS